VDQSASDTHRLIRNSWLAWTLCGLICLSILINLSLSLTNPLANVSAFKMVADIVFGFIPVVFAILGALILSRQPRNMIGWLLMIPAIAFTLPAEDYVNSFTGAPPVPPVTLFFALWLNDWNWLLLMFPIFFILLLFPTGQPPSPRWRWLIVFGLAMCAFFIVLVTFQQNLSGGNVSVKNPIGFIADNDMLWSKYLNVPWAVALLSLTVLCAASLFVRYRHAAAVEREQIKWLLYACGLFVVVYLPLYWISDLNTILADMWNVLFSLAILAIPIAIAIAILRYRLWEIDVLIRRTLVYGALTLTLALVYFGGVVLLQALFEAITGQGQSPIATVISTLGIAAMFTPLRHRIKNDIDRRFYRKKYDAEKTLAAFAARVRDEVELDRLTTHLLAVVQETLQPEHASLWFKESKK
jgi:hypothetical protein